MKRENISFFPHRGRHPKRAARPAALLGQPIRPEIGLGNNQKLPHSFNDGLLGSSHMQGRYHSSFFVRVGHETIYRRSSNSTVFGTQKKTYYWKFVLLEEFLRYKLVNQDLRNQKSPFFTYFHQFSIFENKKTIVRCILTYFDVLIVLFIRNKATLSSQMCLFKDLAYYV